MEASVFEGEVCAACFSPIAVRLTLLRVVDPTEANEFSAAIVQDFDGVAIENGNDRAGEVGGHSERELKEGTA